MVDKLFNPLTLLVGPCLVIYLCFQSTKATNDGGFRLPWWNILASYVVWLTLTRTAKLLPHLWHRPQDIIHVPAFILFGYYFAIMKVYALLTLHETGWGTRAGIGAPPGGVAAAATTPPEKLPVAPAPYSDYPNESYPYDRQAGYEGQQQGYGYSQQGYGQTQDSKDPGLPVHSQYASGEDYRAYAQ